MSRAKAKRKTVKKVIEKKEVLETFDSKELEGRKTKLEEMYKEPEKDEIEPEKAEEIYAFPTKSRCPRCGSTNTTRTNCKKNKQYRRCLAALCRHKYTSFGSVI